MKIRKIFAIAATAAIAVPSFYVEATSMRASSESTVLADDNSSEKDGKKDKKKKKKEKEVKTPEEVLAMIKALEWKRPTRSGLEIDKYYDDADEFFTALKAIDDKVMLFKVCKVQTPSGEYTIAPVEISTGTIRHKNEAFAQVMQSVEFGVNLAMQCTLLSTGAVTNAFQIGQDAAPLIGNSERKTANVQIAKGVKAFPLLKQLIDSQRGMMNRYFKTNASEESTDSVSSAIGVVDIDFESLETMEMSDEEFAAYMEAEKDA